MKKKEVQKQIVTFMISWFWQEWQDNSTGERVVFSTNGTGTTQYL